MMGILGALSETGYLVPLLLCVLGAAKTGVLVGPIVDVGVGNGDEPSIFLSVE